MLAVRWPGEAVRRAPDVLRAAAACLATYAVLCCLPALPAARRARPAAFGDPRAGGDELGRGERARPHAPHGDAAVAELARRAAAHPLRRAGRLRRGRAARGGRRRGGDGPAPAHPGRGSRRGGGVGAVARGEPRGARPRHRRGDAVAAHRRACRWSARSRRCGSRWWSRCAWRSSSRCGSTQLADRPPGRAADARAGRDRRRDADLAAGERAGRDARRRPGVLRRRGTRPDAGGRRRDLPAQHRRLGGRGAADAVAGRERVRLPDHRRVLHRLGRARTTCCSRRRSPPTSRAPSTSPAAARRRPRTRRPAARDELRALGVTAVVVSSRKARTSGRCSTGPGGSPGCPVEQVDDVWLFRLDGRLSAAKSPYPGQGDAAPRPGSGSPTRTVSAPPPACSRHWPRAGSPSTSWRSGWRSSTRPATPPTCCRRSRTCPATTWCRCSPLTPPHRPPPTDQPLILRTGMGTLRRSGPWTVLVAHPGAERHGVGDPGLLRHHRAAGGGHRAGTGGGIGAAAAAGRGDRRTSTG